MQEKLMVLRKIEDLKVVKAIRMGLVDLMPVLLIGAFALVLMTFPVAAYQDFITHFANGFLMDLFDLINFAAFGLLSIYAAFFISRAYMRVNPGASTTGAAAAAIMTFFILAGKNTEAYGPKSMFLAIISGLGATALYSNIYGRLKKHLILSRGADKRFNIAIDSFRAVSITVVLFAVINLLILRAFNVESARELMAHLFTRIIDEPTFGKGLIFVFLSSLLWFFGIHGSDVLEDTMQMVFAPGIEENRLALAAGAQPSCIVTKQFFDCFVLMGGCGATICLLVAILLFSKNRGRRELGAVAAMPMIFNINELMVFGLPIIYNPIMLLPFLITPIVCYCISYFAVSMGWVPVITGNIEWTTPIILGGYYATGSIAGSILQIINLMVGILIYAPFVKLLDRESAKEDQRVFGGFMKFFIEHESEPLKDRKDTYGEFARDLMAELHHDMNVVLYYQPQYDYEGKCVGAEALMRLKHPEYGVLYPPLVIKLAEEGHFLPELEEKVVTTVIEDLPAVRERLGDVKVSFNITGTTVVTDRFIDFCKTHDFTDKNMCIEITEQAAVTFDERTINALKELHGMGLTLAIDDFSMGHTSINYLKDDLFDFIKLDGSLIKGLTENENCKEIVTSITQLAQSLGLMVIAEFVETEEQREILHKVGCDCYQGWLYSPAIALKDF